MCQGLLCHHVKSCVGWLVVVQRRLSVCDVCGICAQFLGGAGRVAVLCMRLASSGDLGEKDTFYMFLYACKWILFRMKIFQALLWYILPFLPGLPVACFKVVEIEVFSHHSR